MWTYICAGPWVDDILVSALVQATPGSALSLSDPLPANCVPSITTTHALPMRPHTLFLRLCPLPSALCPRPRLRPRARLFPACSPWRAACCLQASRIPARARCPPGVLAAALPGNDDVGDPVAFVPGSAGSAAWFCWLRYRHCAMCASSGARINLISPVLQHLCI